jgi:hypothetical protein
MVFVCVTDGDGKRKAKLEKEREKTPLWSEAAQPASVE